MNPPLSANPELTQIISTFDWIVFSIILIVTLLAVIWGNSKKLSSGDEESHFLDHLLLGRQLTLPLFIATLVATWYGGIFGVTEIAFQSGIYNFITQGFFWYVTYIIFAIFMVQKIKMYDAVTLPHLVEKIVGPQSAKLASFFNIINIIPIAYVISLGLFIDLLTGWGMFYSSSLGVLLVFSYSVFGGFRSVIYSDLVQFFVMCIAVFLVLAFSLFKFGGPSYLQMNLPSRYFSITGGHSWAETLSWGFIALSTLVDPNFYQRCLAAKDVKTARRGILFSTIIWIAFDICTTFGAMYAKATIPEAASGHAYLTYSLQILPSGLRGLFLAGILATILSTLDSYLFLAGTTLSFDILKNRKSTVISSHRLSVLIVSIIALGMSFLFDGNIKSVWKTIGSYSASCLLMPLLYAQFFPTKLRDRQFLFCSLFSVICVTLWKFLRPADNFVYLDELYVGMLTSALILFSFHLSKDSSNIHN